MRDRERMGKTVAAILLILILLVGLFAFDDYGFSTDEPIQRQHSLISYRSVMRMLFDREVFPDAGPALSEYVGRYYGVAMQLPLAFAEDMVQLVTGEEMPTYAIYRMRHLYTFLVYWFALVCLYLLNRRLYGNRWLAMAGVLMVFLFGRFFAHSFYNIKDMIFASLLMITLTCAERIYATGRKPVWCLLFAFSGALLVSSRIIGALLILLVLSGMLLQDILAAQKRRDSGESEGKSSLWKRLLPYLLICCAYPIWIVVTPAAWSNPIAFSLGYVTRFSNYTAWNGPVLFAGKYYMADALPRSYYIVWILATVPILNQILCLLGIGLYAVQAVKGKLSAAVKPMLWTALLLLVGTFGYQIIVQPNVYNDWRHVFFTYPLMILFAVFALQQIFAFLSARCRTWTRAAVCLLLAGSLLYNGVRIVKLHPSEQIMFNAAGARYASGFEGDYWQMTYYAMARWLLRNGGSGPFKVYYIDPCVDSEQIIDQRILSMLMPEKAAPLRFVPYADAEYVFVRNTKLLDMPLQDENFREIYAVELDGTKYGMVYQRIAEE